MKARPPAIVEITRGPMVESRHEVDIVVADAGGGLVSVFGEAERPVFPRSSVKAFQALAVIESGAADRFGFEERHVALCCASHHGEDIHVTGATEILAKAGLTPQCLECGAQLPHLKEDEYRLVRAGEEPGAIHNNCSGKHSGFLAFAVHEAMPTQGYVEYAHPVQRAIAGIMEEVTGARHGTDNWGIDGCSIPTYAIPLDALAKAFARFSVGEGGSAMRGKAMLRIRDACFAHPEMVGGTGDGSTIIMQALKGRAFAKSGAEGGFIAALPEQGLGIALKVRDGGAGRAAEIAVAGLLESLLELSPNDSSTLKRLSNPPVLDRHGKPVGEARLVLPQS